MTDLYPDEEGHISDGLVIGFCKAVDSIELHEAVALGSTGVSGFVSVKAASADGDAVGIALKSASAGDVIPVCFYGVVKVVAGATITTGQMCMNDALGTYILPIPNIEDTTAAEGWTNLIEYVGLCGTGTRNRLGIALQPAAASGDEFLLLVGGIR